MRLWTDESGKTLVIALVVMGIASLLIGGFLVYVSTSQRTMEAAQETLKSHYAADAGVEHALWRLTHETGFTETVANNGSHAYPISIDGQMVNITITLESGSGDWTDTWSYQDIGNVEAGGSTSYHNGVFTVAGSGEDIWGNTDEFHYVYQTLNGDGEIIARIDSMTYVWWWSKAGVMIRESLDSDAPHAFMAGTPDDPTDQVTRAAFQRRLVAGDYSYNTDTSAPDPTEQFWVRIVRNGDTFTGYWSTNGTDWNWVDSVTINMSSEVHAGLAVTSHEDGTLCTATFSEVTVVE
jgi:regulation of enolase protein 1 (concanavalin A-like superfamily)